MPAEKSADSNTESDPILEVAAGGRSDSQAHESVASPEHQVRSGSSGWPEDLVMNLKFVKFLLGGEHQELRVRLHPKRVRPADTSFLFAIRATNSFITQKLCASSLDCT